jgi:hypothetical protein
MDPAMMGRYRYPCDYTSTYVLGCQQKFRCQICKLGWIDRGAYSPIIVLESECMKIG